MEMGQRREIGIGGFRERRGGNDVSGKGRRKGNVNESGTGTKIENASVSAVHGIELIANVTDIETLSATVSLTANANVTRRITFVRRDIENGRIAIRQFRCHHLRRVLPLVLAVMSVR